MSTEQLVARETGRRNHTRTYILSCDLAEKVASLKNIGLETPTTTDPIFTEIRNQLVDYIDRAMKNVSIDCINMSTLVSNVMSSAQNSQAMLHDNCIVSTCIEMTTPVHGCTLDINRLVNHNGEVIGLGPRPGCARIDKQILDIITIAANRPIVIIEDGSFTGSTIVYVVEQFKKHNTDISKIVLGLMFPQAEQYITDCFNGELVVTKTADEIIDWIPDHDFFPWIPNCGRVLGHKFGNDSCPIYSSNGSVFSIPYIMPYIEMEAWTTISDLNIARDISLFCLHKTIEIYEIIENLNGRKVTSQDFRSKKPTIGIPFIKGFEYIPDQKDIRIIDDLFKTVQVLVA